MNRAIDTNTYFSIIIISPFFLYSFVYVEEYCPHYHMENVYKQNMLCHMANRSCMIRINIHITYSQVLQSQFIHQRTMCKTYNSEQLGFINMNIQHINFPSMLLGVLLILSLWLCCRFRKGCRMFTQRHKNQSVALRTIAESMSQRPTIRTPIRGTDPLFIDL